MYNGFPQVAVIENPKVVTGIDDGIPGGDISVEIPLPQNEVNVEPVEPVVAKKRTLKKK